MNFAKCLLLTVLGIPLLMRGGMIAVGLFASDQNTLFRGGFFFGTGWAHWLQLTWAAVEWAVALGIAAAVYLGENWARLLLLVSAFIAFVSVSMDIIEDPHPFLIAIAGYLIVLVYILTRVNAVREFLASQAANKAPEPTP